MTTDGFYYCQLCKIKEYIHFIPGILYLLWHVVWQCFFKINNFKLFLVAFFSQFRSKSLTQNHLPMRYLFFLQMFHAWNKFKRNFLIFFCGFTLKATELKTRTNLSQFVMQNYGARCCRRYIQASVSSV